MVSSITVYRLPTKETNFCFLFPFAANKQKFTASFVANKGKLPFLVSSVFRIYRYRKQNYIHIYIYCGDPAISLHSYTVPLVQWFTRLLLVMRDQGSIPRGVLVWIRDSFVSIVSLHWWPRSDWSLWPRLRRALSRTITRPLCRQCDNPTWSNTAFLFRFHARCRSSFQLQNRYTWLLGGGALWRA
jgi:hypothetical protein